MAYRRTKEEYEIISGKKLGIEVKLRNNNRPELNKN